MGSEEGQLYSYNELIYNAATHIKGQPAGAPGWTVPTMAAVIACITQKTAPQVTVDLFRVVRAL